MNIIDWTIENKLASNIYSAAHIVNNLHCAGLPLEEQKRLVALYRKWRRSTRDDPRKCFQYTLEGKEPPQEMI